MPLINVKSTSDVIGGEVDLPLSKSISNRALMMNAISGSVVGYDTLSGADDTQLLRLLLDQVAEGSNRTLNAGNAGTVVRFLLAYLAITPGKWILHGDDRMHNRPIAHLVNALLELGADIDYIGEEGYPPVQVFGNELSGGPVNIDPSMSSQYVSALMMIGPMLEEGLVIALTGEPVSLPYIFLTRNMMKQAGAETEIALPLIHIPATGYSACILQGETDWSAAAPWYELMALAADGELLLKGLKEDSMQGDRALAKHFRSFGVNTEFHEEGALLRKTSYKDKFIQLDLTSTPDLAPSIIVTAAALGFDGYFTGLSTLKIKESNRLEALATELGKVGISCAEYKDEFSFEPHEMKITKPFYTYNDHRLAMAFAPLSILGKPVAIHDPKVVNKSYPGFWSELQKVLGVG